MTDKKDHNWAAARAEAVKMSNFLQRLNQASEVFDAVLAAEAELVELSKALTEFGERVGNASVAADEAEASRDARAKAVKEEVAIVEKSLAETRAVTAEKIAALTSQVDVARESAQQLVLGFEEQSQRAAEGHDALMIQLEEEEIEARARIAKIEERREQLLKDLGG